jgi:hypothetical protein
MGIDKITVAAYTAEYYVVIYTGQFLNMSAGITRFPDAY